MNICSLIVHCKPENAPEIRDQLLNYDGVDVFGGLEEGKIIATIEGNGEKALSDIVAEFNHISGVIDTAMVYHQEVEDDRLDQEM